MRSAVLPEHSRSHGTRLAGLIRSWILRPCAMKSPTSGFLFPNVALENFALGGRVRWCSYCAVKLVRIGIGGPVGSGKTMLVLRLCEWLREELSLAVVTNDIYTREDAEFLVRNQALPAGRVIGVETAATISRPRSLPNWSTRSSMSSTSPKEIRSREKAVRPLRTATFCSLTRSPSPPTSERTLA